MDWEQYIPNLSNVLQNFYIVLADCLNRWQSLLKMSFKHNVHYPMTYHLGFLQNINASWWHLGLEVSHIQLAKQFMSMPLQQYEFSRNVSMWQEVGLGSAGGIFQPLGYSPLHWCASCSRRHSVSRKHCKSEISLHNPRVIKEFLAFAWYGRNFTLGDFITFLTQIVTFCLLKFPLQTEVSLSFSKCREYI